MAKVLEAAADARERLLLLLMHREGIRAIEVAGLQLADVDLSARTRVVTGKGGHSRVLPVADIAAGAVETYLA